MHNDCQLSPLAAHHLERLNRSAAAVSAALEGASGCPVITESAQGLVRSRLAVGENLGYASERFDNTYVAVLDAAPPAELVSVLRDASQALSSALMQMRLPPAVSYEALADAAGRVVTLLQFASSRLCDAHAAAPSALEVDIVMLLASNADAAGAVEALAKELHLRVSAPAQMESNWQFVTA